MNEQELIGLMLPDGMLDYFEITNAERNSDAYTLHLAELNIAPDGYKNSKLVSKGFYEPTTIQDFPLRGKACYLTIKRRRWFDEDTGTIVMRDWSMVAKGTRITTELAAFLKELDRYHAGKLP